MLILPDKDIDSLWLGTSSYGIVHCSIKRSSMAGCD